MKRDIEGRGKRAAVGGATSSGHERQPAAGGRGSSMRNTTSSRDQRAFIKKPTFSSSRSFLQSGVRKPSARRREVDEALEEEQEDDDELRQAAAADEEEEDEDSDEELTAQQQQLAEIPFEVLEVLRQDGSGLVGHAARQAARAAEDKQRDMHRANRHRPSEMSSKKPVSRFRDVIQVTKREAHDPRFESAAPGGKPGRQPAPAGPDSHADKAYAFLYEEVIPGERKELKQRLKKEKNPKFKARIQMQLTQLEQATRSEEARKKRAALGQGFKSAERQAVASGKKPFYLKKSEQRRLELVAQYEELKSQGRLDKFMEKRRKKNAAKDHRYVPSQRRPDPSQDS